MKSLKLREMSDALFVGDLDISSADHHPVHARMLAGEEILPDVFVYVSCATSNVFDTGQGLVMLDCGRYPDKDSLYSSVRDWRPRAPLVAGLYSHHHLDHVHAVTRFDEEASTRGWPSPVIYAHRNLPGHFDRYRKTVGWQTAITKRQQPGNDKYDVSRGDSYPVDFRYPDVTIEGSLQLRLGRLTFEMHHSRGETDDAIWTWIPELRTLHTGDLFIWAVPNCGNPQKVQRYAGEWAHALRQMAALAPEVLLPGHGIPIFGQDKILQALSSNAELLESLENQTIALMNRGKSLDEVIHTVKVPNHLLDLPFMRPIYDHPEFIVRNIWRQYGGWWDLEMDNLLPAPREAQAAEWIALAGGIEKVLDRVAVLLGNGQHKLASHLIEFAVLVEPSERVHRVRSDVYSARVERETASMCKNIFTHASISSKEGKRDLAGNF